MIVAKTDVPFLRRSLEFEAVIDAIPCGVDLIVYSPDELERLMAQGRGFHCRALAEGIVVYARPAATLPDTFVYRPEREKLEYRGMVSYDPVREARRWFRNAQNDLAMGQTMLNADFYSGACFHSHQACEKALKTLAFLRGDREVRGHSLTGFVTGLKRTYPGLLKFEAVLKKIDPYYVTTRYPDVLEEGEIPSEKYKRPDAEEALDAASKLVEFADMALRKERNG
jgi:HEPN domain-containing protein